MIVLDGYDPRRLVSANKRIHHHTRADLCRNWRGMAERAAREAYGAADGGEAWHQKVRIVITVRYPDGRGVKDPANLYPYVGKPIVDGLVDARVIPADDYRHVIGPDMRRDEKRGPHRIVIDIEDLGAVA